MPDGEDDRETESAPIRESISSLFKRVVIAFSLLQTALREAGSSVIDQIQPSAVEDELARFRLWAGNVGAHRKGRISLDYQLRFATHLHDQVTDFLGQLIDSLHSAIKIAKNGGFVPIRASSPSSTSSSEVSSDEESDASGDGPSIPSPIQLELREISLRVKCLMKLSVVLRQPVPRDRTAKYAQIPMDHWKPFDQDHVRNKLSQIACTMAHDLLPSPDEAPNANPGSKFYKFEAPEFLIERLGTANTRRRQFLQYLKEHHDKITKYVDAPVSRKEGDIEEGFETKTNCDTDKYTFGLTMDTQTSVTTVPHAINLNPVAADDVISESGQTGTSYATSVAHPDEGYLLKVPPLPKPAGSFEDTFECPYCFYFLNVKSQRAWKHHVFRDLKPYVCTFEKCMSATQLYETCHEWFEHETQFHRREWYCASCNFVTTTKSHFREHIQTKHSDQSTADSIIRRSEQKILSSQNCTICGKLCRPGRLAGHMGKHMEQIALFVLKNSAVLEDDQDQGQSDSGDVQFSHEHSVSSAYSAPERGTSVHPVTSTYDHGRINRPLFVPSDNGSINLSLSESEDPLRTDALDGNRRIPSDRNSEHPLPRWTKLMGTFISPRAVRTEGYDFDIINPHEIIIKSHLSETQIVELEKLTTQIRTDTRVSSLNGGDNDEPLLEDLKNTDEWAWRNNIATEFQRTDISVRAARAKGFEVSVEDDLIVIKPPLNFGQYNELIELSKDIRGADTDGARSSPLLPTWTKVSRQIASVRAASAKGYKFDKEPNHIIIHDVLSTSQTDGLVELSRDIRGADTDEARSSLLLPTWTKVSRQIASVRAASTKGYKFDKEPSHIIIHDVLNTSQIDELVELSRDIRGADTDETWSNPSPLPIKHSYPHDPEHEPALSPLTENRPGQKIEAFAGPRPDVRPWSEESTSLDAQAADFSPSGSPGRFIQWYCCNPQELPHEVHQSGLNIHPPTPGRQCRSCRHRQCSNCTEFDRLLPSNDKFDCLCFHTGCSRFLPFGELREHLMAHIHAEDQAVSEFAEATKSKQPENNPAITTNIPDTRSATSESSEQFKASMIALIRDIMPETFLVDDVVGFWEGLEQDNINPKDEARYLRQRRQRYAWVEGLRNDPACVQLVEREDRLLAEMDRRLADKLPSSSTTEPKAEIPEDVE